MPFYFWEHCRPKEIYELSRRNAIVLLPVTSTEQHGTHLPLGTDTLICKGFLDYFVQNSEDVEFDVVALPFQNLGTAGEHKDYSGTLSLSPELLIGVCDTLMAQLAAHGFQRVVLLTTHGGNHPALEIISNKCRHVYNLFSMVTSLHRLGVPEGLFSTAEARYGIHAGAYEMSLMLALYPQLVSSYDSGVQPSLAAQIDKDFQLIGFNKGHRLSWTMKDLNPSGWVGDLSESSPEKGDAILRYTAKVFGAVLKEFLRYTETRI